MIGYTRKVGLRKPGTWEWAIRNQVRPLDEALRIKVRAGSLCADCRHCACCMHPDRWREVPVEELAREVEP